MPRVALGLSYRGQAYNGWQSQPGGRTVQDRVEAALSSLAAAPVRCISAGRTDAGVHALNQVVHFDTDAEREAFSWVRGTNRFLPEDIAVEWCRFVPAKFHSRANAIGRRYAYVLRESPVRPALEVGLAGWSFRPLDGSLMNQAANALLGEHDFSAFRSSECQALSPVKTMRRIEIERRGAYWRLDFEADAFLHHMIRNIMGCLVAVGSATRPVGWLAEVLQARDRALAAPTFSPDGLYFVGPYYDPVHDIPEHTAAMDWLP